MGYTIFSHEWASWEKLWRSLSVMQISNTQISGITIQCITLNIIVSLWTPNIVFSSGVAPKSFAGKGVRQDYHQWNIVFAFADWHVSCKTTIWKSQIFMLVEGGGENLYPPSAPPLEPSLVFLKKPCPKMDILTSSKLPSVFGTPLLKEVKNRYSTINLVFVIIFQNASVWVSFWPLLRLFTEAIKTGI